MFSPDYMAMGRFHFGTELKKKEMKKKLVIELISQVSSA